MRGVHQARANLYFSCKPLFHKLTMNQPSRSADDGNSPAALTDEQRIQNYTMAARAQRSHFGIHDQSNCLPNPTPHRHEYFQIYVNLKGETTHFLGSGQRPIGPGTVSFVMPYRVHYIPNVADGSFYVINISKEYLLPALDLDVLEMDEVGLERAPELAPFRFQGFLDFQFDADDTTRMESLCKRMAVEAQRDDTASSILIRSCLLEMVGLVWRRYGDALRDCEANGLHLQSHKQAVLRFIRYVVKNLDQEITLTSAAAACYLSPTHLAHLLKKETGKTFLEIVTERRIDRAKSLLVFTGASINEVCATTGFTDVSHFARRFKQIVGASPTEYKKLHQRRINA
jgi:AraC-like DNA-binding protein/mannose-6-phosphate isomerase-like protein (cupin superfamily)